MKLSFVGKNLERVDAAEKVGGLAKYGDDLDFPGMLYASAVRSPRPRIEIKRVSGENAKKAEGFVTLVTHVDVKGVNKWPIFFDDYPFLPESESKFEGEAVALAVGETRTAAKKAASLAELEYKELPFVEDSLEAMKKNSPKVYGKDNVVSSYRIKRGNAFQALKKCDYVVEGEFRTNYQVHAYLETQVVTAVPHPDGSMSVYSSTQCPFYVLEGVCAATGLPNNRVKVIQTVCGGGFGGKEDVPALVAAHAAICAQKTGKPVRMVYDREEDFQSMSKRHPSWARVCYGADKNGKIKSCVVKYVLDAGAYATISPIVLWRGTIHAAGPYDIENVSVDTFAVATNKAPCGAFRGFGQPQICFAQESLVDDLAEKIGINPIDFRLKNIIKKGSRTITGQKVNSSCALPELIKIVRKKSNYGKFKPVKKGDKVLGLGFSNTYYGVGLGALGRFLDRAGAYINIYKDGTVSVNVGNIEMGQGALTVLTQICAETLNCPIEKVRIEEVDTSKVPDSGPTVASRTTLMSGNAIIEAAKPLRERIFFVAKKMLGGKSVMLSSGGFFVSGKKRIKFEDAVKECWANRLKMSEQGWYAAPGTTYETKDGQGDAYVVYSYSVNAALVEVDAETCEVQVKKIWAAYDVGRLINPKLAHAQAHGGIMQGMSWAVFENLVYEGGVMKNPNLTDYAVASSADKPEYVVSFVEKEYKDGPYKAKGMGELPLIAVAPAIRNAIKNAIEVGLDSVPMLPEKIWKAKKQKIEQ